MFGPELEIGADVMAPPIGAKKVAPAKYKLFGGAFLFLFSLVSYKLMQIVLNL